ncbi:MAG: type III-B CRISPR module RAMP protein Cmr6 [Bacteroidia bacterium]|nr:type III-B CRISPR module RAMP protein Cmr6 [Bacteroidia bacterium]MDW8157468.1 type III-B CRISPR module RAMP protein Cmr6 [Bacteroidia bacterium]
MANGRSNIPRNTSRFEPFFYLPKDTEAHVQRQFQNDRFDNFGLFIQKYVVCDNIKSNEFKPFLLKQHSKTREEEYNAANFFRADVERLKELSQRRQLAIPAGHMAFRLTFSAATPLIVGLGNESVYETSITFHPVYGFPYIPGQALKGSLRSFIIVERFGASEKEAFRNECFTFLFGKLGEEGVKQKDIARGALCFFEALPLENITLQLDIMNPHYSEYYTGNKPPADYLSPVPILFLSVKAGATFEAFITIAKQLFHRISPALLSQLYEDPQRKGEVNLESLLKYWLEQALGYGGIGAKTAIGYGYMNNIKIERITS